MRRSTVLILSLIALVFAVPVMAVRNVAAANTPVDIVLDADIGVDDSAAIAYLLSSRQANVIGITTVAGNTTVENSANNALLLLEVAGRTDVPVVIGAGAPLVLQPSLQGMFVHGPDGLWFAGMSNPHDLSSLRTDAPEFLRDSAVAHPGATLLALGPLTNIARAIQLYPGEMALYSRIVWSGGARVVQGDGNTPVSTFNSWYDPDAAQIVLNSGLPLVMVAADAGRTVVITEQQVKRLAKNGTPLGKFLAPILTAYASAVNQSVEPADSQFTAAAQNRNHKQKNQYSIPLYDPTATVLALRPDLGTAQSALVFVQTPDGVTRGQTVIGLTIPDRMQMIADDTELSGIALQAFSDPNFDMNAAIGEILSRQPDNANVVLDVNSAAIARMFMNALVR